MNTDLKKDKDILQSTAKMGHSVEPRYWGLEEETSSLHSQSHAELVRSMDARALHKMSGGDYLEKLQQEKLAAYSYFPPPLQN